MKRFMPILGALVLCACGGASAPAVSGPVQGKANEIDRRCSALALNGTVAFSAPSQCVNCIAANEKNAIDGSDGTWATLASSSVTQGMSLRATAAQGVVFPAGSTPAFTLTIPRGDGWYVGTSSIDSSSQQRWHITVRTYLDNQLQDEDAGDVTMNAATRDSEREVVGLNATKPFDSIEAVFDRPPSPETINDNVSGAGDFLQPAAIEVHEFCGTFDLTGVNVNGG